MFPSFRKVMARTFSVPKIALEVVSLFLTLTGFLLVFLSLLSNGTEQLKSLYFLKLSASNMTITFGLYNYCMTKGDSSTVCFEDDSIMVVPYGKLFRDLPIILHAKNIYAYMFHTF